MWREKRVRPGRPRESGDPRHWRHGDVWIGGVVTGQRILVVEDNERNLKLIRDVLQFAGYEIVEASSGEQGVALAQDCEPDLVLMDLQLPQMDGMEALRLLRTSPRTRDVPVVAVTAFAMRGTVSGPSVRGSTAISRSRSGPRATGAGSRVLGRKGVSWMTEEPTVLVIDDLPQNTRLLEAILIPKGYQVVPDSSGEEGLQALQENQPDLVLLDILMPGMDGYEVCRRIREDPATAFLPVVMITASGDQEKRRALETGADDFVTKPFDQTELLARVRSLVRIKQHHDTIERQREELAEWNRQLGGGADPGGGARPGQSVTSVPLSAGRRAGRGFRRRVVPAQPPAGNRRGVLRPPGIHCRSRRLPSPRRSWASWRVSRALGDLIFRFEGTLERFAGDGLMVFFNDPMPCDDGPARAVRMSAPCGPGSKTSPTDGPARVRPRLRRRYCPGYATLGGSGSKGGPTTRLGRVTNLARDCAPRLRRGKSWSPNGCMQERKESW